ALLQKYILGKTLKFHLLNSSIMLLNRLMIAMERVTNRTLSLLAWIGPPSWTPIALPNPRQILTQCSDDLYALDKLWALSAIELKVAKNLAHQLSPDVYRALRRDYLHHSASNKGIANPAHTNKDETSISKERRELIGNKVS
ncbi:MAG: hypothetical protein ACRDCK_09255, partial [Plesiomonas shigelloides]